MVANSPKPTQELTKQSTKQPVEKQKELQYAKSLLKDKAKGAPYHFDVLAELVNIPVRITLYEFLRLSKSTRKALREALANIETFMARILAKPEDEDEKNSSMPLNMSSA